MIETLSDLICLLRRLYNKDYDRHVEIQFKDVNGNIYTSNIVCIRSYDDSIIISNFRIIDDILDYKEGDV